ncbi:DNA methyltransferase [Desulfococcaceae bacterium HSG7]|nr:DNA methyltransferase [Desulfococcaceae bacterium HSG7]
MQLTLFPDKEKTKHKNYRAINKLQPLDHRFHDWYRFVLSFPPHLVREYSQRFGLKPGNTILDPFCGTGTTILEGKLCGIHGVGIESNDVAYFASKVKTTWNLNADELIKHAEKIAQAVSKGKDYFNKEDLRKLPEDSFKLLIKNSISPIPLHKTLCLLERINLNKQESFYNHELLALAHALVFSISNLHFGPEVGVRRKKILDASVVENWLMQIYKMGGDLKHGQSKTMAFNTSSEVFNADSRNVANLLKPESIDAVFTSPPYPNEKDYTRTTRLESVLLGFINDKHELRTVKKGLLRSNTRNVYKGDEDHLWVEKYPQIIEIADKIEAKRIELGKTSGFEKLYGRVTKLYFGGMARHLSSLRPFLKPGAHLGYVVGDQASYLRIMIRTGQFLAEIAQSLGYELINIDLFRTRMATATKSELNEEVVVLRWNG